MQKGIKVNELTLTTIPLHKAVNRSREPSKPCLPKMQTASLWFLTKYQWLTLGEEMVTQG